MVFRLVYTIDLIHSQIFRNVGSILGRWEDLNSLRELRDRNTNRKENEDEFSREKKNYLRDNSRSQLVLTEISRSHAQQI